MLDRAENEHDYIVLVQSVMHTSRRLSERIHNRPSERAAPLWTATEFRTEKTDELFRDTGSGSLMSDLRRSEISEQV